MVVPFLDNDKPLLYKQNGETWTCRGHEFRESHFSLRLPVPPFSYESHFGPGK